MTTKKPNIKMSWSRFSCWEKSREQYRKIYILGEKLENKYTLFGKAMHSRLESNKPTDDPRFERIKAFLPKYKQRELVVEVKYRRITLKSVFDGLSGDKLGDYKFSKKWTQQQADKCEQLTFYALVYWLKHKKIPQLFLHWCETYEDENGELDITGGGQTFATKRTIEDLMLLWARIQRAHKEIIKFTAEQWAKI